MCLEAMKEGGIKSLYMVLSGEGELGTGFRLIYDSTDSSTGLATSCRYTVPRAGAHVKPSNLKMANIEAAVAKTTWLYLDSGSLYASSDTAVALAERITNDGMHVVFNLSLADTTQEQDFGVFRLVQMADVIILNEETAKRCDENHRGTGNRDWLKGATTISETPPLGPEKNEKYKPDVVKWVVVTRGDKDITIIEGHPNNKSKAKVSSVKVKPVEPSEGSDSRGVGDIFAGGLVGGLAEGQSVEDAVSTGIKLAAYSLTQEGPQLPAQSS